MVEKRKKIKKILCRVSKVDIRQSIVCRVSGGRHSAKKLLCRVSPDQHSATYALSSAYLGHSTKITTVRYRRLLTVLCRAPPLPSVLLSANLSVPSVLHSVKRLVTESRTLPSAALGKSFFAECPTKGTRQRLQHSAKPWIPVVLAKHG